jgi:circadian clock protein KaiB
MKNSGLKDFERASKSVAEAEYHLRLYISGITPRSTTAIANIKKICDEQLPDRCQLEIVDIYQEPALAKRDQIVAVPTLVKLDPAPVARLVGDMSNRERVMRGLNLQS